VIRPSTGHRAFAPATDFGREMQPAGQAATLEDAFRARSARIAAVEVKRHHLTMAAIGFVGGLVFVVPSVVWLAQKPMARVTVPAAAIAPPRPTELEPKPARDASIVKENVQVRRVTLGSATQLPKVAGAIGSRDEVYEPKPQELLALARHRFRAGDLVGARAILAEPNLELNGEALFLLAETWDPNVLAALGIKGAQAEAETAKRYYEASLAKGMTAATKRLEALR
jgi:hypothetical protein